MGNLCCIVCEWDDFIEDDPKSARYSKTNQKTNNVIRNRGKVAHKAIEEDPVLEDMCEIAGLEADRDAGKAFEMIVRLLIPFII